MTSLLSADEGIGVRASSVHPGEVSKVDSMSYSPAAPEVPLPEPTTSREIPAYFALEFPDVQFTYYLQKLSVSLGRSDAAADIDLGALKNISRLHARIEYEEQLEQFVLAVIGRNGAFVDSVWHEPGERVPLAERTLIQISQRSFYFILPPAVTSSLPSGESPESGAVPGLDSTNTTADGSHSPSTTPRQTVSSSHSRQTSPSPTRGRKGKGNGNGRGGKGGHVLKALKARSKRYTIDDQDDQLAPASNKPIPQEGLQLEAMEVEEGPLESTSPRAFTPSSRSTSPDLDADPDYKPVTVKAEPMVDVVPTAAPGKRPRGRPPKRKRESSGEEFEARPPAKKSKKGAAAVKTTMGKTKAASSEPTGRKDKGAKDVKPPAPGRRKSKAEKPKSLFTTAPAPPLSEMVAKEAAAGEAGTKKEKNKGKAKVKKEAESEAEVRIKQEGSEGEGAEKEKGAEKVGVRVPEGPPPQKPPFTFPLLCYKALQALGGKAPYRAITKWLEKEYPYFALSTKEGKDGWENSTRHTLSSHRAFVKIDRRPEEKGKGCFWSFNPEYEMQFSDQWQAALANSRNPAPPRPAPPPRPQQHAAPLIPPNRMSGAYPHPHPPWPPPHHYPPPVANGVTPPHLMPHSHPPYPPSHLRPPYPPFSFPSMPPPPGFPHPPPTGAGAATAANKNKAPKKSKALGSAFSRVPLIRPGIVPPSGGNGKEKDSPFSSVPLVRKGTGGKEMDNDGCSDNEEEEEEEEKGHVTTQASAQPPMGGMYPPRTYGYGPPRPPLPPHPNRPPPHARLPILLSHLPSDAPPCGPEPVTFYDGNMYLRPEAHMHLTEEDMKRLNELCVGEAFGYLLARSAGVHRPPFPPIHPMMAGNKEKTPTVVIKKDEIETTVEEAKS